MKLAFKYRIYPNKEQLRKLEDVFWFCRFLYNSALQERIERYKQIGKSLSYSQQCTELADVKWYFPNETAGIYSQTLQADFETA